MNLLFEHIFMFKNTLLYWAPESCWVLTRGRRWRGVCVGHCLAPAAGFEAGPAHAHQRQATRFSRHVKEATDLGCAEVSKAQCCHQQQLMTKSKSVIIIFKKINVLSAKRTSKLKLQFITPYIWKDFIIDYSKLGWMNQIIKTASNDNL